MNSRQSEHLYVATQYVPVSARPSYASSFNSLLVMPSVEGAVSYSITGSFSDKKLSSWIGKTTQLDVSVMCRIPATLFLIALRRFTIFVSAVNVTGVNSPIKAETHTAQAFLNIRSGNTEFEQLRYICSCPVLSGLFLVNLGNAGIIGQRGNQMPVAGPMTISGTLAILGNVANIALSPNQAAEAFRIGYGLCTWLASQCPGFTTEFFLMYSMNMCLSLHQSAAINAAGVLGGIRLSRYGFDVLNVDDSSLRVQQHMVDNLFQQYAVTPTEDSIESIYGKWCLVNDSLITEGYISVGTYVPKAPKDDWTKQMLDLAPNVIDIMGDIPIFVWSSLSTIVMSDELINAISIGERRGNERVFTCGNDGCMQLKLLCVFMRLFGSLNTITINGINWPTANNANVAAAMWWGVGAATRIRDPIFVTYAWRRTHLGGPLIISVRASEMLDHADEMLSLVKSSNDVALVAKMISKISGMH